MALSAGDLTMEEAHWRVMSKSTEIKKFLQQHTYANVVGNLRSEQWAEAGTPAIHVEDLMVR